MYNKKQNEWLTKLANRIKPFQLKIEVGLLLITLIGMLLQLKDIAPGPEIVFASLPALAVVYFILSFKDVETKIVSDFNLNKVAYISFSVAILGTGWSVWRLSGSGQMILIASCAMLICLVASILLRIKNKEEKVIDSEIIRMLIILFVVGSLYVTRDTNGLTHKEVRIEKINN
jgi:hypothetical protein